MTRHPKGYCGICLRADVDEINTILKNNGNVKILAEQIGINKSVLHRHKNHLDRVIPTDQTSIQKIDAMETIARELLDKAVRSGDLKNSVQLIDSVNRCLSLSCKLRGEMSGAPVETGILKVDFDTFTDRLLAGLDEAPQAKTIVLHALSQMGDYETEITGSSGCPTLD